MTDGPLLWFLNRATGLSLLVLLSATVVLGVLALGGRPAGDGGGRTPRFVTQELHRNLALGSGLLLLAHVGTAVVDEFVDIRWWHVLVPWGASYEPLWLALGTVSLDLLLAIAITSLLRSRLGHRSWRLVHVTSWGAWASAVVHGVAMGTDLSDPQRWTWWSVAPTVLSVLAVVGALGYRFASRRAPARPVPVLPGGTRDRAGADR